MGGDVSADQAIELVFDGFEGGAGGGDFWRERSTQTRRASRGEVEGGGEGG